jgi:hypothetical protein
MHEFLGHVCLLYTFWQTYQLLEFQMNKEIWGNFKNASFQQKCPLSSQKVTIGIPEVFKI